MKNLQIFYSTLEDGNMNTNPKFYPEEMTREKIKQNFYVRRLILGRKFGFEGNKILVPSQKSFPNDPNKSEEERRNELFKYYSKYHNGKYIKIDEKLIKGYNDLYDVDLQADILMIDSNMPGIVLAYPVADCPVIFAEDTKQQVTSMAHCGGEYIDRNLPEQIVESLFKEVNSKPEDIKVMVGPYAHKETFIYDKGTSPSYVKHDEIWKNCLFEDSEGLLHVDMAKAILRQLQNMGIKITNIEFSNIDTVTDPRFYSNNRARFDKEKAGRFYTGCVYLEDKPKEKIR